MDNYPRWAIGGINPEDGFTDGPVIAHKLLLEVMPEIEPAFIYKITTSGTTTKYVKVFRWREGTGKWVMRKGWEYE